MNETREKLRADFYAKTDISPGITACGWKNYAEYLEELAIEKINNELLVRNNKLNDRIEKAIGILEAGLTER